MNSVDTRPSVSKRVGQRMTLQWQYPEAEIPKIQEYRIYRADRIERNFQKIASVPINVLEHTMDATEPGDFVLRSKRLTVSQNPTPAMKCSFRSSLDAMQSHVPHSVRRFLGSPNLKEVAKQLGYEEECDVWPGSRNLFGTLDENLHFLETAFEVRLSLDENNLIIEGSDAQVGIIERLIADYDQVRREGVLFSNSDLKSVIRIISEDSSLRLRDCFPSGKSRICGRKAVTPRSLNQRRYLDAIEKV